MTENLVKMRNRLIESNSIVEQNGEMIFPDDYLFSSPSAAASMVLGRNANGLTEWKLKDGTSLKVFESKKIQ